MFSRKMEKELFKKEFSSTLPKKLEALAQPYLESYNWFLEEGVNLCVQKIPTIEIDDNTKIWFESFRFDTDYIPPSPEKCRLNAETYHTKLIFNIALKENQRTEVKTFEAKIPLMLRSKYCRLRNMNPVQLARNKEEAYEHGGYFIIKGNEKILRMLIVQKRNYPLALVRSSWKNKGKCFHLN